MFYYSFTIKLPVDPFAPEPPVRIHVLSTACDVISFNGQGQLCLLTAHLPFLSPNPKIQKAFLNTLPTKMKPTKCPAREKKNEARKAKKEGRRESKK